MQTFNKFKFPSRWEDLQRITKTSGQKSEETPETRMLWKTEREFFKKGGVIRILSSGQVKWCISLFELM